MIKVALAPVVEYRNYKIGYGTYNTYILLLERPEYHMQVTCVIMYVQYIGTYRGGTY